MKVAEKYKIDELTDEIIEAKLKQFYPNYSYPDVNDLVSKDLDFHKALYKYTKLNGTTPKGMMTNLGFEKATKYDRKSMLRLKNEYSLKPALLAEFFEVERQAIAQELDRLTNKVPFWLTNVLTSGESHVFEEMITQFVCKQYDQNAKYLITSNQNQNTPKFAFLIHSGNNTKMIDNIPKNLQTLLVDNLYHIYSENDLLKIHELLERLELSNETNIAGEELKILNHLTMKAKNSPFNKAELLEHFGNGHRKVIDARYRQDEEIIELFEKYKDPVTGIVKIKGGSNEYYRIVNLGQNRNLSLAEFIRSYGYQYERIVDRSQFIEKRKRTLQNYVVQNNEVYISSFDPLYMSLTNVGRNRNQSLDEHLLVEFGLIRIKKEDLPIDYIPYEWRNSISDLEVDEEEEFVSYIEQNLVLGGNKVYISSQSTFYSKLWLYAYKFNKNVTGILESWGYERIYEIPNDFEIEPREKDLELAIRIPILDDIRAVQGELERDEHTTSRIARSTKLVQLIKSLYLDACQLCDHSKDGAIPRITMQNGREYVEVHHILKISSELTAEDESNIELDSYLNVIVVCSHHHKVLHYEKGGYMELLLNVEDMTLYFKNEEGIIPLVTDYHLIERFAL